MNCVGNAAWFRKMNTVMWDLVVTSKSTSMLYLRRIIAKQETIFLTSTEMGDATVWRILV